MYYAFQVVAPGGLEITSTTVYRFPTRSAALTWASAKVNANPQDCWVVAERLAFCNAKVSMTYDIQDDEV